MIRINTRLTMVSVLAVIMHLNAHAAAAHESGTAVRLAFLDRIFGDSERLSPSAPQQAAPQSQATPQAQAAPTTGQGVPVQGRAVQPGSDVEMMMRIDRLEAQIRQLTGVIEQLQHRNQQLESRLGQTAGAPAPAAPPRLPPQQQPAAAPQAEAMPAQPPATGAPSRRGDAFDPSQNPGAPGAPRVLGSIPSGNLPEPADEEETVGAPGGRQAGAPLDLSTLAAPGGRQPQPGGGAGSQQLPAPPPRTLSGTGAQVATLPPSDSPRDHFDLAYGYITRKDYALAENGFRGFIQKFPGDRLAPDAHYWLGESMFQRQRYRDAAETFLNVSTKYETAGRAPDALLRLGQSLAALGEKEAACASLAEVLRKYPRASVAVRQGVDREQKRVRC